MRISTPKLVELCQQHVYRFQNLARGALTNMRPTECDRYLGIWERGLRWAQSCAPDSMHTRDTLSHDKALLGEVIDAFSSGGYDELFEVQRPLDFVRELLSLLNEEFPPPPNERHALIMQREGLGLDLALRLNGECVTLAIEANEFDKSVYEIVEEVVDTIDMASTPERVSEPSPV